MTTEIIVKDTAGENSPSSDEAVEVVQAEIAVDLAEAAVALAEQTASAAELQAASTTADNLETMEQWRAEMAVLRDQVAVLETFCRDTTTAISADLASLREAITLIQERPRRRVSEPSPDENVEGAPRVPETEHNHPAERKRKHRWT